MTWIKVCGITRREDAIAAARLGFDAVGFIFTESPRRIGADAARDIGAFLPESVLRVGVFGNEEPEEIEKTFEYCRLDMVQLHGDQRPEEVARWGSRAIKVLRLRDEDDLIEMAHYPDVFAILIDAWHPSLRGGTGKACDWDLAGAAAKRGRVILAGGLDPGNISSAIRRVRPFGVDVCSGVEASAGRKAMSLMEAFKRGATAAKPGDLEQEARR
jgi:phosphoribosylanthranilate isomerase